VVAVERNNHHRAMTADELVEAAAQVRRQFEDDGVVVSEAVIREGTVSNGGSERSPILDDPDAAALAEAAHELGLVARRLSRR
jgi:hypothetical protein